MPCLKHGVLDVPVKRLPHAVGHAPCIAAGVFAPNSVKQAPARYSRLLCLLSRVDAGVYVVLAGYLIAALRPRFVPGACSAPDSCLAGRPPFGERSGLDNFRIQRCQRDLF